LFCYEIRTRVGGRSSSYWLKGRARRGLPSNSSADNGSAQGASLPGQPGLGMNLSWHAGIRLSRSQRRMRFWAGWKILDFGQTVLSDARTLASLIFSLRGIGQGIDSQRPHGSRSRAECNLRRAKIHSRNAHLTCGFFNLWETDGKHFPP